MRRLIDIVTLALVAGSIALQGAFLTAIRGTPGAPPALTAGARGPVPAALSAQVCVPTTDRKC